MPRDSSGNYTLPSGNPVITGSTIASSWANTTLNDLATEMTDSLSRSGKGGMTSAFKVVDGLVSAPGLAFANEPGSGLYRIGAADWGMAVTGALALELTTSYIHFNKNISGPANSNVMVITGVANAGADVFIGSNATTKIGFRLGATGANGEIMSFVDGNTGNQEWQIRNGILSAGTYDLFDIATSKTVYSVAPTTDVITFSTPMAVNGVANSYGVFITGSSTSGQSLGEIIRAGTTAADFALRVQNQAGTQDYMYVRGDGAIFIWDGASNVYKPGYKGAPPNVQGGNYTLTAIDNGKSVVFSATAALTLPQSIFVQGDMQVIVAQGGVVTITQGTGVTLTWANASGSTGNRTLTNIGIATLWWQSATQCYVTGSGLS